MTDEHQKKDLTAQQWRTRIRNGEFVGPTSGIAPQYVQGNLVVLPLSWAEEFQQYCARNPKPCPLLAVSRPGESSLPELGAELDIRTDLPRYRVWSRGELIDEPTQISSYWREDLVSFVLGCSFSFEWALTESGIRLRHVDQGCNVAMYRTRIETIPAGRFHGPMVVSMRPIRRHDLELVCATTARYPRVHGAPIHIGDPEAIGIEDLSRPDYGDPVPVLDDELPVFWACGVTPQAAIEHVRPELCITHAPGAMLITDLLNEQLAT